MPEYTFPLRGSEKRRNIAPAVDMVPSFCGTQPEHTVTKVFCLQELKKIQEIAKRFI